MKSQNSLGTFIAHPIHALQSGVNRIRRNGLVSASFFVGISSVINIAAVFVIQKVIAVYLGPAGVAYIGQYQNFLGITTALANGGINSGIVKYVAEYRKDTERNAQLISNALRISLVCSGILSVSLLLFAEPLSSYLFHTDAYVFILRLLGLTITFFALNTLLVSVLNGFGEIRKYSGSAIARSVVGLVLTIWWSIAFGVTGALVALTVVQSLVFFVTLFFVVRSPWFTPRFFLQKYDSSLSRKLLGFSLIALTTSIIAPVVQIGVRNYLISTVSVNDAGYWDAMWKISQGYLSIVTGTLSVYYMPKLSSLHTKDEIRREIWSGYKIIIPFILAVFLVVYWLRDPIVLTLYSDEFMSTVSLFLPMLLGDFFKMVSWLVAFIMLAKAMIRMFIVTQVAISIFTYVLSVVMINAWGLEGAAWAHVIKYIVYTIVIMYLLREYLFSIENARSI